MTYRLGVDVGGTFTDVLLVEEGSGATWRAKTASTPSDQAVGVRNGIAKVCDEAGIALSDVAQVLHGTTVATNAILEGKGATVGLVTTKGFRQVLQIARSYVPGGLAGWIIWPKPEPLAALENTVEVDERIASDGTVIRELDDADVRAQLAKLTGIDALAVSLINSFADPAHERRIAEIAAEVLPGVPVSLSSDVLPEMREYERTITTVANGYVQPQVKRYVETLAARLRESGVAGELAILRSDGGLSAAGPRSARRSRCCSPARPAASRARCGPPSSAATPTSSRSTWAAPPPTSRWCRASARASGARPRSATSPCARPAWTFARSARAAARSRTCRS